MPASVASVAGVKRLRIAMIGTRGVPAAYGGFETAVEEIGKRLVARGHKVTVYCRNQGGERVPVFEGMDLVHLPAIRAKALETLSHTALSIGHVITSQKHDAAFVFNAANSPFVPILRSRRIPTAVHMDGLEWKRGKWGPLGRRYYRFAEQFAVRWADALIADAQGIADYYKEEFGADSHILTYGATIQKESQTGMLARLGLHPGQFHLVVARFEPENHVDAIVEGYHRSSARLPLIVVGSAPYSVEYTNRIKGLAESDKRIRFVGGIWDQNLLDQLYANALTYVHGHSVGGTNPSLLRAMGAGTAVLAFDVIFNREVLRDDGKYFVTSDEVANLIERAEALPEEQLVIGLRLQTSAGQRYDWDGVAFGYEGLARRLAAGGGSRGKSLKRCKDSAWPLNSPAREPQHV